MSGIRVGYVGHDFFSSCLAALVERPDLTVAVCLTLEKDDHRIENVTRIARGADVRLLHGPPTDEVVSELNSAELDLLVCGAYLWRLPVERLSVERCANIHPSLLPEGRGPNPIPYLVSERAGACGITIHEMTPELDRGPILLQAPLGLDRGQGADELILRLFAAAPRLLTQLVDDLDGAFARKQPQGDGSFWPEHTAAERTLATATARVLEVAEHCRRFGSLDVLLELADGTLLRGSRLTVTTCRHDEPPGRRLAEFVASSIVSLSDGLLRVDDPAVVAS